MTRKGWLLFIAMSVFWGIPYLFIKLALRELDPSVDDERVVVRHAKFSCHNTIRSAAPTLYLRARQPCHRAC